MHENRSQQADVVGAWLGDTVAATPGEPDAVLSALDALWGEGPPEAALDSTRDALDAWWAGQHDVIAFDSLSTPIGEVYAAASDEGIISVEFGMPDEAAFVAHLHRHHLGGRPIKLVRSQERMVAVVQQLDAYFRGELEQFDFKPDLRGTTDFQREVLAATRQIPPGEIVTYKEIARRIGRPRAFRAVGNALGRNPVPIMIPCHRVVAQDGSLGGYSGGGGTLTKAQLLALEGVVPQPGGQYATA